MQFHCENCQNNSNVQRALQCRTSRKSSTESRVVGSCVGKIRRCAAEQCAAHSRHQIPSERSVPDRVEQTYGASVRRKRPNTGWNLDIRSKFSIDASRPRQHFALTSQNIAEVHISDVTRIYHSLQTQDKETHFLPNVQTTFNSTFGVWWCAKKR